MLVVSKRTILEIVADSTSRNTRSLDALVFAGGWCDGRQETALRFLVFATRTVIVAITYEPLWNTSVLAREIIRWTSAVNTARPFIRTITAIVFPVAYFTPIDTDSVTTAKLLWGTRSSWTSPLVRAIPAIIVSVTAKVPANAFTVVALESTTRGGRGIGGVQEDRRGGGVRDVGAAKDRAPRTTTDAKFRHFYSNETRLDFFF